MTSQDEFLLVENLQDSQYIFLVVNPSSGGRAASHLLTLGFNFLQFIAEEDDGVSVGRHVKLFIGDVRTGSPGNKDLFHIIKAIAHAKRRPNDVRIIVAGGDGTVSWVFAELEAHGVDSEVVSVGVLPFGTGNDFANATGTTSIFARHGNEEPVAQMKRLCEEWLALKLLPFDLWEVEVDLAPGGVVKKIDSQTKQKVALDIPDGKPLCLPMLNYFSFGVESRIGLGFDRNRTNNPILNRGAYAVEGIKKFAFHRTQFIDNLIEGLHVHRDPEEGPPDKGAKIAESSFYSQASSLDVRSEDENIPPLGVYGVDSVVYQNTAYEPVFKCRPAPSKTERLACLLGANKPSALSKDDSALLNEAVLRSPFSSPAQVSRAASLDPGASTFDGALTSRSGPHRQTSANLEHAYLKPCVSLLFLNIPSFAGGLDPWAAAEGKIGVRLPAEGGAREGLWDENAPSSDGQALNIQSPETQKSTIMSSDKVCFVASSSSSSMERVANQQSLTIQDCILQSCRTSAPQDFGDGKIEVIGFQSLVELSLTNLERILPAHIAPGGWRIYQGSGDFLIPFRAGLPTQLRVYFQVDGEFFLANAVKNMRIRPLRKVTILATVSHKRRQLQTR